MVNPATDESGIPMRPTAPIVLRFFGCDEEMVGLNGDYFTLGDTGGEDVALPPAARGPRPCKLRFSRAAEGWRLTAAEEQPYFLNQRRVRGLAPLRSGDVVRLSPGAAGVQFTIVHQQAESLARLTARFAPRLLRGESEAEQAPPAAPAPSLAPPAQDAVARRPSSLPSWAATVLIALVMLGVGSLIGWVALGREASDGGDASPPTPSQEVTAESQPTPPTK